MTDDKKLEELKMTAYPFILLYQSIYEKMGFVEGNEPRTSATATVFISTKDEWKSAEYDRKQEAKKSVRREEVDRQFPLAKAEPTPVPEFKTAFEMTKAEPATPTTTPPEVPKAVQEERAKMAAQPHEPPKTDEPSTNMFGTDRWGKAWPTSLVCLNLVPTKEDPKKFELCGGVAQTHRSRDPEKAGNIFAICPKCNHFLKHDGKPGKLANPQE